MEKKQNITAIVLAKNEEARIETCLNALTWIDEVVVICNNSTDKTEHLAKKLGAKVYNNTSRDFSTLRNFGMKKATHDWVLYIDADEVVTGRLRDEITHTVHSSTKDSPKGFYITRQNYYLGKPWPTRDKMQRLFYKPSFISWKGKLHESAEIKGEYGVLENPLSHYTHRTIEEMVEKTNTWSEIEADLRLNANHPKIVSWRLFRVWITGFIHTYIRQGGYKAGTLGIIESMYQGFSAFITYAKLWEKQQKKIPHQVRSSPVAKSVRDDKTN